MNKAYLLIGGNTGDRKRYLKQAIAAIQQKAGTVVCCSRLYETAAWGKTDQPAFLNQCLLLETLLEPEPLLDCILQIESQLGRIRSEKYGPRTIDIDILLFNHLILESPRLRLPHPELPNRRFALAPLQELAPHYKHPVLQQTITGLLNTCSDPLPVLAMD